MRLHDGGEVDFAVPVDQLPGMQGEGLRLGGGHCNVQLSGTGDDQLLPLLGSDLHLLEIHGQDHFIPAFQKGQPFAISLFKYLYHGIVVFQYRGGKAPKPILFCNVFQLDQQILNL